MGKQVPGEGTRQHGLPSQKDVFSYVYNAEDATMNVKVMGASQEMCSYLPLLQKLPAALVIRKVKVTKHSSRVSLREIFT